MKIINFKPQVSGMFLCFFVFSCLHSAIMTSLMTAIILKNLPLSKCGHLEFLLLTTSPFIFYDFPFLKTDPVPRVPV